MGALFGCGMTLSVPLTTSDGNYLKVHALELPKGHKPPFEFQRESPDCFSCREKGLISRLLKGQGVGNLVVFLKLWQEAWGSSRFLKVNSRNLACCLKEVMPSFGCDEVRGIAL